MFLRFTLSNRDVEDLLAGRGIEVTYETIRRCVMVLCPMIARRVRAQRPKPYRRWNLDELFVRIGGRQMYRWRAVDAKGEVLEVLDQDRCDARAAAKLMCKLLQGILPDAWVMTSAGPTVPDSTIAALEVPSTSPLGGRTPG